MSPSFFISCFMCVRIPLLFICFGVVSSYQSFDVFVCLLNSRSVCFSVWSLILQCTSVAICDILFLCIFSQPFVIFICFYHFISRVYILSPCSAFFALPIYCPITVSSCVAHPYSCADFVQLAHESIQLFSSPLSVSSTVF